MHRFKETRCRLLVENDFLILVSFFAGIIPNADGRESLPSSDEKSGEDHSVESEATSSGFPAAPRASSSFVSHHSQATSATSYFDLPTFLPKEVVLGLAQSTAGGRL